MSKSRRLQVLVEDEQYDRLQRAADTRGVSVATVVREAIDSLLSPVDLTRKREALAALLAAPPMAVPEDPAELEAEIAEMYDRAAE